MSMCIHTHMHTHTHIRDLGDFKKEEWPMHTEQQRAAIVEAMTGHHTPPKGTLTYGIVSSPILNFPLKRVIPCNMHCVMAILCKLVHCTMHMLDNTQH